MKCSACAKKDCGQKHSRRDRCKGAEEGIECSCKCQEDGTGKIVSVLGGTAAAAGGIALTLMTGGVFGMIAGAALVGGGSSLMTTPIAKELQGERLTADEAIKDAVVGTLLGAATGPTFAGGFAAKSAKMFLNPAKKAVASFVSSSVSAMWGSGLPIIKFAKDTISGNKTESKNIQKSSGNFDKTELTNTETTQTIGGSHKNVQKAKGNFNRTEYEIAHFFAQWTLDALPAGLSGAILILIQEEFSHLMIKEHHRVMIDTGSSFPAQWNRHIISVIIQENGIAAAIIEIFGNYDEQGFLPQYAVAIIQIMEKMLELGVITVQDFNKILNKLLEYLNSNEQTGNFKMPVGWNSGNVGKLFDKLRKLIRRSKK